MYEVKYSHPAFPREQEFDTPLGLIKNGETVKVTEEMEAALVAQTGMSLKDYFHGNNAFQVKGTTELKGSGS